MGLKGEYLFILIRAASERMTFQELHVQESIERVPRRRLRRYKRRLRKFLRRVVWNIGGILAPMILNALKYFPRDALHAISKGFGSAWYYLIPSSRALGIRNLDKVYGDSISHEQKAFICRESFKGILTCMMDYYYFSFHPEDIESLVIIDPGFEEKIRPVIEAGKGILVFSAHIGNWELLASYMKKFAPTNILARKHKDFSTYVIDCRKRHGVDTIPDDSVTSMKKVLAKLNQGEMVGFILDRNLRDIEGIMVDFMGIPAFTPYYPVKLAQKKGIPVMGMFLLREGSRYRLCMEGPFEVKALDNNESTYRHYTEVCLKTTEKYIRDNPEQWFWAHKRWGSPKGPVVF
jgi:Kdo2-lipid IVA lauroyltransferase/acyltransferase